jgi:phosphonate transport system ATP-binding protein
VQAVLEVRRVSKAFDRRNAILKGVSFSLLRGEMVALIGASGSGKSTLIRAIAGLVPIDKGSADNGIGTGNAGADNSGASAPGEIILFGQPMQRDGRISGGAKQLRVRVGVIF